jgi:hypothetical protein
MQSLFETFENWLRKILKEIADQQNAELIARLEKIEQASFTDEKFNALNMRVGQLHEKFEDLDISEAISNWMESHFEDHLDCPVLTDKIANGVGEWMDDNITGRVHDEVKNLSFEVTVW